MSTFFVFILFSSISVGFAIDAVAIEKNPFSPKAFVIRYWDKAIRNNLPKPSFLLSKASPLSAADSAAFAKLAATNTLSTRLPEFCSAAHLLCFPDVIPSLEKHNQLGNKNYGKSFNEGSEGDAKGARGKHKVGVQAGFPKYAQAAFHYPQAGFPKYAQAAFHYPQAGFPKYATNGSGPVDQAGFPKYAQAGFPKYATDGSGPVDQSFQPGKFFRERMLKQGTVMPMPDIRDKMPQRSFLPRSILSKLPFASSKISELKRIFKVSDNSSMEKMMMDSLGECERAPIKGENKRCVGSVEDMIDFATSVLGRNVVVRSTESVNGSKKNVMVGRVRGINGGGVTQSVSCHQSLFPYLLYYCHSLPNVRVYEADLLDPNSKAKINHGVATCHLDTTAWSPTHEAFVALGSGPGRIEVCHWIFENDMTWTIAD